MRHKKELIVSIIILSQPISELSQLRRGGWPAKASKGKNQGRRNPCGPSKEGESLREEEEEKEVTMLHARSFSWAFAVPSAHGGPDEYSILVVHQLIRLASQLVFLFAIIIIFFDLLHVWLAFLSFSISTW